MQNLIPEQIAAAPLGLEANPVVTGLWQVADMERDDKVLDRDAAAAALMRYVDAGFHCFDMADHYGSAELIAGQARQQLLQHGHPAADKLRLYTKWCPQPDQHTPTEVDAGIRNRLDRLGVDCIDLLQLHWWHFDHPGYIDVMDHLCRLQQDGLIKHLGLTNVDTDHLQVLLSCGFPIVSNQVCVSVLDPRALGDLSDVCNDSGVGLLAYGSLAGGLLSERWLGAPEPTELSDWSKMKYQRFVNAVGGWDVLQGVLGTLNEIAEHHQVSIANVATRWVLQQQAVAGVIVGARLTEREHCESNRKVLEFELSGDDLARIQETQQSLTPIPGDCGSEYRRPPFLTASGDLSHHLDALPSVYQRVAVPGRKQRWYISSGSEYEPICGYSRGVRTGNRILISGTTATHGVDRVIGEDDLRAQMVYILDKISASIASLGGSLEDVVRTRIYLTDAAHWEVVSRVHGRYFSDILPANTLIEISRLVGPYAIEMEAEAILDTDAD